VTLDDRLEKTFQKVGLRSRRPLQELAIVSA
jgi:hypothetical protein